MSKKDTEEKHPLLLYIVESSEDLSKTNKRYFERGRLHGITSGATAVFRQFPNYVGTCWVATALCGLIFFMMVLLVLSSITTGGIRVPRCITRSEISNNTIHLVHTNHANEWQPLEVDLFQRIAENYPKYKIHLILIQHNFPTGTYKSPERVFEDLESTTTSKTPPTQPSSKPTEATTLDARRKKRKIDDFRLSINMSAKRLLDMLLHGKAPSINDTEKINQVRTVRSVEKTTERIRTVDDLLRIHPNIILDNTTFNHIFYMSPLYAYWPFLNEDLRVFAVRVLQLWQYGGISFDLSPAIKQSSNETIGEANNTKDIDSIFNKKLMNFIITEKKNYEKLPTGVVTADDEALHMESKIPCHAFFGEILMNLRKAEDDTTVKDILQESLMIFCKNSAANKKYCDIISNVQK